MLTIAGVCFVRTGEGEGAAGGRGYGDAELLTVRKRDTSRGGTLDPGETAAQAAMREVHEEFGLTVR